MKPNKISELHTAFENAEKELKDAILEELGKIAPMEFDEPLTFSVGMIDEVYTGLSHTDGELVVSTESDRYGVYACDIHTDCLYEIYRHASFEMALKGTSADTVTGLVKAFTKD